MSRRNLTVLAKGDRILEINFDVTNGARLPLENEDHDKSAQAKAAKLTVKEAIARATQPGIQPIEASLLMKEGKPQFQVNGFTSTKTVKVLGIDALTGEILKSEKTPAGAESKDEKEK